MILRTTLLFASVGLALLANRADAQFVLGVNLSGDAVTINGNLWQSETAAASNGFSFTTAGSFAPFTYGTAPSPAVDAATAAMLLDVRYVPFSNPPVTLHQTVPNGQAYVVELWAYEGAGAFGREATISGDIATTNFGNLNIAGWEARSLTTGVINDGSIDFTMTTVNNQPVISGFAIFKAVPEPASHIAAASAAAAVVSLRRRRR
jgi:hypothetical protein